MFLKVNLIFLLSSIIILIPFINITTLAQPAFRSYYCENMATYAVNSEYQRNLETALDALPTTNRGLGFYKLSVGQGNDTVNSVALCRGDINRDACQTCLNDSIVRLRKLCPNQKAARGYYDFCFLVYSNEDILSSTTEIKFYEYLISDQKSTDTDGFNRALEPLMTKLRVDAAAGNDQLKFASGNTSGPGLPTIYGLVQCNPDLSEQQCNNCLENAISRIGEWFNGEVAGRILLPMCNFRYATFRFFGPNSTQVNPRPSPPIPQPPFLRYYCENTNTYTVNGGYQKNLDNALDILPTATRGLGFHKLSIGQGNDTVNSVALCRGDINPDACDKCLNDSIVRLRKLCPNQKTARGYYDLCLLVYSSEDILNSTAKIKFYEYQTNVQSPTDSDGFNRALGPLMERLRVDAAAGNDQLKFASGNTNGPGFTLIYGIAQCNPDLSEQQCGICLEDAISRIGEWFNGATGGRIFLPMCNYRYETYNFFNQSTTSSPPVLPPPSGMNYIFITKIIF
ncbi:hypothetical protein SSX86_016646 [Deinandra increscens subsp. villosa]|uniref:Gnk2-homologous domain-containing protein n=1 Tax=Deinandra increscens subsp. villosa TaxID=3103831 RepID=A0AAP0GVV7_9ASTR